MPAKNDDLHGNVPETSPVALVLVDVINDLEFDGGKTLLKRALPMARRLASLAERARKAGVAVIYVNDNFGKWRSDFRTLLDHCLNDEVTGRELAHILAPEKTDYFMLKPKHSGFFSTTLDTLLESLRAVTHGDFSAAGVPACANARYHGADNRQMRSIHGKRRSHARPPSRCSGGLLRRSNCGTAQAGNRNDGASARGRHYTIPED